MVQFMSTDEHGMPICGHPQDGPSVSPFREFTLNAKQTN